MSSAVNHEHVCIVSVSLLLSLLHFLIGVGSSTEFTVGWLKFTAFLQYKPVNIKFESNIFAFGALDNLKICTRFCWDIKDLGKIKKSIPEMLLESCSRPPKSQHSPWEWCNLGGLGKISTIVAKIQRCQGYLLFEMLDLFWLLLYYNIIPVHVN